jgi:hypothetical protein
VLLHSRTFAADSFIRSALFHFKFSDQPISDLQGGSYPTSAPLTSCVQLILLQHFGFRGAQLTMWECDSCYDRFYHEWQCDEHMDEERHHACSASYCNKQFGSQRAAEQHMNTLGHWAVQYHCHSCAYAFPSISARDTHHDEAGHWEHYCSSCKRAFGDANQLKMVRDALLTRRSKEQSLMLRSL